MTTLHPTTQHPVTIRPFWMGKCEVTWDEFDLFWNSPSGNPAVLNASAKRSPKGSADLPFAGLALRPCR